MNIGWIGTGIMGASMAGRLQAAGHALSVYNRTRSKAEALLGGTASWCDSPAEVASKAEIVFTIVGHPRDVEEVYLGGKGILSSKGVCRIVVDMTTSRPSLAQIISEKAALLSIESLDAPVSGGDVGARNGTLAIMVGGAWAQGSGDLVKQVQAVFEENCAQCHRLNGEGLPDTFPALNKNPYVLGDPQPVIATVLNGRKGNLGAMPGWKDTLDDQQIAAVVTYIRQAWSNRAAVVTAAMVAAGRGK